MKVELYAIMSACLQGASWQQEQDIAALAGEVAENSSVSRSVQPVTPLLLARNCISTGVLTTLEPWNEVITAHSWIEYTMSFQRSAK